MKLKHWKSETSKKTAEREYERQISLRERIFMDFFWEDYLGSRYGFIADEIYQTMRNNGSNVHAGSVATRFSELERGGCIAKTPERRKTKQGNDAVVYVATGQPYTAPPPRRSKHDDGFVAGLLALKEKITTKTLHDMWRLDSKNAGGDILQMINNMVKEKDEI